MRPSLPCRVTGCRRLNRRRNRTRTGDDQHMHVGGLYRATEQQTDRHTGRAACSRSRTSHGPRCGSQAVAQSTRFELCAAPRVARVGSPAVEVMRVDEPGMAMPREVSGAALGGGTGSD